MIIGIHRQPKLPEDESGVKIVAGDTLEDVYRTMVQQLRLEYGDELTTITFSNGLQVVVRREENWDNPQEEDEEDEDLHDEFSEFDDLVGSGGDLVDTFTESATIQFRELSRKVLSKEELRNVFTSTVYFHKE